MTAKMPEKLERFMMDGAPDYETYYNPTRAYKEGFDACWSNLAPLIQEMREALEQSKCRCILGNECSRCWALAKAQELLG